MKGQKAKDILRIAGYWQILIMMALICCCSTSDNGDNNPENVNDPSVNQPQAPLPPHQPSAPLSERLPNLAPQLLNEFGVRGMAVAIIKNGEVEFKGGFGSASIEDSSPVSLNTIFNIGSVSKMFAGLAAMNLVRQGVIDLDAPITNYISSWDFPESVYDHSKITLRRLMQHTGGTSLAGYPGYSLGADKPTIQESLSGEGSQREGVVVFYDPGNGFFYSGGGISVIQLAIEETAGMGFEQFMKTTFFEPLNMNASGFSYTPEVLDEIATPYGRDGNRVGHTEFTALGAAGMLSSLNDLITLSLNMIDQGAGAPAMVPGLDIETIAMTVDAGRTNFLVYETAHQVRRLSNTTFIGHIGTNNGWRCNFQISPFDGHAIITMANGSSGGPDNVLICEFFREITGVSSAEFCN